MKSFQLYGSWAQLTNYQYLIFIKQGNALPYPCLNIHLLYKEWDYTEYVHGEERNARQK